VAGVAEDGLAADSREAFLELAICCVQVVLALLEQDQLGRATSSDLATELRAD
jgi:hypothetical protein